MEPRVSLITLGVTNLQRSLSFYRDGLGWRLSSASVEGDVAFIQLNGIALALWSREELAKDAGLPPDDGWGGITLSQNFHSVADVDAAAEAAMRAGGTMLKPPAPTDWGGYAGYVADPDGHPWELAHNPSWHMDADGSLTLPE
ncbi:MAG TPA: VOC family protein [Candidatus Limnocylindrales bacterium]|jgi:catechol 2,3-dioxygenase-like lactoylglutathione lyase family enzyme|nr:VOC family protein [Candidatus Limnocylindrales bacterium]